MAAPQPSERQNVSRLAPIGRPGNANPGYRYRGKRKHNSAAQQTERVRKLLQHHRQLIHLRSSGVRSVSAHLNQLIGQALSDGLKITVIAEATQLSRSEVRRIGLSFQDVQPAGLSAHEHLKPISMLRSELAALEESKERIARERLKLLAEARRKGLMDDYELASLSGLNHEHLPRMTRGVEKQRMFPGPLPCRPD